MKQGGLRLSGRSKCKRNENRPLISVITVVLNGERTIEKTIRSVIEQSYDNIEYIIIDGNSTDNTIGILKKYEDFIDFWISEPDVGIADAFNKGLRFSTGNYIGFINSDDWYEKDGIRRLVNEMNLNELIYCGHLNLFSSSGDEFVKLHKSNPKRIFQTMRISHPSTLVNRSVFDEIGEFSVEYEYAMDYDFFLRARLNGHNVRIVDHVIANQRIGGKTSNLLKVYKEELKIKNALMGCKAEHWLWYLENIVLYFLLKLKNRKND